MGTPNIFEFDLFRVDAEEQTLTCQGKPVSMTPKALKLLIVLVRNSGRVVCKEDLLKEIWRGAFVEEGSLAVHVFALRKALGRSPDGADYIQTVPTRGYRFVGQVKASSKEEAAPAIPSRIEKELGRREPVLVVVLPTQNLTGSPAMEHISDGFTDAMISQLACVDSRELSVIARTSSMSYKRQPKTIREIASELQIDYAIESSIRMSGERVLISVQLIRADRQTHLWSRDYNREFHDLVAIQTEIAHAVASEIDIVLSPRQTEPLRHALDPAVYELYLKGRFFANSRTDEGLRRGIEYLERALSLDPSHAQSQSALGACWAFCSLYGGLSPFESFPKAKTYAMRALDLNPYLSEAHATLGLVHGWHEFDWSSADRAFRRSIELEPGNALAHTWYAFFLGCMCRHEEAALEIRAALRHDPLSWAVRAVFALLEEWVGRGHSAIMELEKALELNPGYHFARMLLGYFNVSILGRVHEAITHLRQACRDSGGQPDTLSALACVYAAAGMREDAQAILDELSSARTYVSPFFLARVQGFLGNFDQAFGLLEEAFEERFFWLMMMQNDPGLRPLSRDPRFRRLLDKMAFPATERR